MCPGPSECVPVVGGDTRPFGAVNGMRTCIGCPKAHKGTVSLSSYLEASECNSHKKHKPGTEAQHQSGVGAPALQVAIDASRFSDPSLRLSSETRWP